MKTNIDFPRQVFQGANFDVTLTVDAVLTGYKVRCEIFDEQDNSATLANTAAGGANTQITLTPGVSSSTIVVYVAKNTTTIFKENSWFEVEVEDANGKITPLCSVRFKMLAKKITWTTKS
jgi:hypothetical protein